MKFMNKRGGKKGSKFFDDFIRNSGENFLESELESSLMKKMPTLCRDIAFGNVDLEKYGKYFTPRLVNILYKHVYMEYFKRYHIFMAMHEYVQNFPNDAFVLSLAKETEDKYKGFEAIFKPISEMYNSCGPMGYNLSYIDTASVSSKNYRYLI